MNSDKLIAAAARSGAAASASPSASTNASASPNSAADNALADAATRQQQWAQLITAHPSCFSGDSVAAAKEYLTGPGR